MDHDKWIATVSKIDETGQDEFRAEYNSPEMMWPLIETILEERELLVANHTAKTLGYEPYYGWCDVDGCDQEACGGGIAWRETGYWRGCTQDSKDYREGKSQPMMKPEAIAKEKMRGADGILKINPQEKP